MSPRKAAALRDGDGLSLRDHLIAACERLLASRGSAGLTVRDIAREAQVADGVLYNYFADKEELIALALHARVRNVESALGPWPRQAGQGTLAANLRVYLAGGLALHEAILPAFAGLLAQPKVLARFDELTNPMAGGRGLRAELAAYLRAEQELGRVRATANADAAATMIIGACHELVLPTLLFGRAEPGRSAADVDALVGVVLDGIT